jgi:hypothetical protein
MFEFGGARRYPRTLLANVLESACGYAAMESLALAFGA